MKMLYFLFAFLLGPLVGSAQASCPLIVDGPTVIPLGNHWYKFSITYENPTSGKKSIRVQDDCVDVCIEVAGNQDEEVTYYSYPFYSADAPVLTATSYPGRHCNGNPCEQQVLPVYFRSLRAEKVAEGIRLTWNALIEHQPSVSFSIERSPDGRQFHAIGTVEGTEGTSTYSYTDAVGSAGSGYLFYRIIADGKYSDIASISFSKAMGHLLTNHQLLLYNMPASSVVRMIDMAGREILRSSNASSIPVTDLSPGIYALVVHDPNSEIVYRKLVRK